MDVSEKVKVADKVIEDAKKFLINKSASLEPNTVCHGKCIELDGKDLEPGHVYCHSWVGAGFRKACSSGYGWADGYKKDARNFLTLTCHSKKASQNVCSDESSDFLILWMARESPFSLAILNRDDEKSLTEGGAIILCGPDGLTQAQAMWVCKVLRFTTEGAQAAETFMTLVKGGVDPMLAVYVASYIRSIKGATFGWTGPNEHSTVFNGGYDARGKDALLGLLARNVVQGPVRSTQQVFSDPKGVKNPAGDPLTKIKGFCKPVKKPDGWGGFTEGKGADAAELVTRVLQWQQELAGCLPDYDATFPPVLQPDPPLMPTHSTVYLELDL